MALNIDIINKGDKLGMFNELKQIYGQDATKWPETIQESIGQGYGLKFALGSLKESPEERRERLQTELEAQRQQLQFAQGLGKESVDTAAKYSMLTGLPKTIAQSFGNMAAMNLYAGQAVADTFARTLANYPRAQFDQYQFRPEKYFE